MFYKVQRCVEFFCGDASIPLIVPCSFYQLLIHVDLFTILLPLTIRPKVADSYILPSTLGKLDVLYFQNVFGDLLCRFAEPDELHFRSPGDIGRNITGIQLGTAFSFYVLLRFGFNAVEGLRRRLFPLEDSVNFFVEVCSRI